jgi:hypothetical protein
MNAFFEAESSVEQAVWAVSRYSGICPEGQSTRKNNYLGSK